MGLGRWISNNAKILSVKLDFMLGNKGESEVHNALLLLGLDSDAADAYIRTWKTEEEE